MDDILLNLQSTDTKIKQSALDLLLSKLKKSDTTFLSQLNNQKDFKLKLMSHTLSLLKDSNPKILLTTLDCFQLFLEQFSDAMYPLINMSFELLIQKLGDAKQPVRTRASEVLISFINRIGLTTGYEKLMLQLSHKNIKIRENILSILKHLFLLYGDDVIALPGMTKKLAPLLNDSQGTVRQLAVDVLGYLRGLLGEAILDDLITEGIRPGQIRLISDSYQQQQQSQSSSTLPVTHHPIMTSVDNNSNYSNTTSTTNNSSNSSSNRLSTHSAMRPPLISTNSSNSMGSTSSNNSSGSGNGTVARRPSREGVTATTITTTTRNSSDFIDNELDSRKVTSSEVSHEDRNTNNKDSRILPRKPSSGSLQPRISTISSNSLSTHNTTGDLFNHQDSELHPYPPTTGSLNISNNKINYNSSLDSKDDEDITDSIPPGKYHPSTYLKLLEDGSKAKAYPPITSERDLRQHILTIATGLSKQDDWEMRMNALIALQGLLLGGLLPLQEQGGTWPLIEVFLGLVKSTLGEELSRQISDLRSTVSKEGCRTVAVLARNLGSYFHLLSELWVPALLKQLAVKAQVIQVAADSCLRTIIAASAAGFPKLLNGVLAEACQSKNPTLRAHAIEYVSMAAAIWKPEVLEKQIPTFKSIIRQCTGDADPAARRAARQLYWVLRNRTNNTLLSSEMENFIDELELGIQKHLMTEIQLPAPELIELLGGPSKLLPPKNYNNISIQRVNSKSELAISNNNTSSSNSIRSSTIVNNNNNNNNNNNSYSNNSGSHSVNISDPLDVEEDDDDVMNNSDLPVPPQDKLTVTSGRTSLLSASLRETTTGTTNKSGSSSRRMSLAGPVRISNKNNNNNSNNSDKSTIESESSHSMRKSVTMTGNSRRMSLMPTDEYISSTTAPSSSSTTTGATTTSASRVLVSTTSSTSSSNATLSKEYSSASYSRQSISTGYGHGNTSSGGSGGLASSGSSGMLVEGPKRIATTTTKPTAADINKKLANKQQQQGGLTVTVPEQTDASLPTVELRDNNDSDLSMDGQDYNTTNTTTTNLISQENEIKSIERRVATTSSITIADNSSSVPVPSPVTSVMSVTEANEVVVSSEDLKNLSGDSLWSNRVKAFETISSRIRKAHLEVTEESVTIAFINLVDRALDMSLEHLSDDHQRVATEALTTLSTIIEKFPKLSAPRLLQILPALFQLLADRRAKIRENANTVLNLTRDCFDGNLIAGSLCPRLLDVGERSRAAMLQYLSVIIPHCEIYFQQNLNAKALLGRLAFMLGCGNTVTPTTAVLASGKRLIDLLYKLVPQIVLAQTYALPLQQQALIKRILAEQHPDKDIEGMVTAAGKSLAPLSSSSSNNNNTVGMPSSSGDNSNINRNSVTLPSTSLSSQSSTTTATTTTSLAKSIRNLNYQESQNKLTVNTTENTTSTSTTATYNRNRNNANLDNNDILNDEDEDDDDEKGLVLNEPTTTTAKRLFPNSPVQNTTVTPPIPPSTITTTITTSPHNYHSDSYRHSVARPYTSPKPSSTSSMPPYSSTTTTTTTTNLSNPSGTTRDMPWLLNALRCGNALAVRTEATKEIKKLIKSADSMFWELNCAQIVSVLLEPFILDSHDESTSNTGTTAAFNQLNNTTMVLTGLSPPVDHKKTSNATASQSHHKSYNNNNIENINRNDRNLDSIPYFTNLIQNDATSIPNTTTSPIPPPVPYTSTMASGSTSTSTFNRKSEGMHNSCKLLLLLIKRRGPNMKILLELLVSRLCPAAAYAPVAVTLHCEQILCELALLDAMRLVHSVLPLVRGSSATGVSSTGGGTAQVRLLALHTLAAGVRHLSSSPLLSVLSDIAHAVLPLFGSALVDTRKAVVFVLVEAFLVVGDALLPFVEDLSPAQRKLLTIYIERQMQQHNKGSTTSTRIT